MRNQVLFHEGTLEEADGRLVQTGKRCRDCGKTAYPAMERCPFCASENTEKAALSKVGTVFSYSVTRVPVGSFKPPIILAYVDLPEGTRVFGQIHADEKQVRAGMKVEVETGALWTEKDGTEVAGYYYVPYTAGKGVEK
ncbi:Zn-ribbon domain-containing OB-fold protein [Papillibacter cinnamivorans]|uniref:Benzoylsuccinyl-CoA thiolase BbsA subunit n=1 Tax=Papillibacter cinnamivorans DSM 12816 TaxID=1122930 RepID=A0A1W2CAT8_9FIRM|nr:OB-fold domain-containing protein [Papillibacter cinnamivorans]SMC81798.1 benzoylsuccinyl-CoA thiolase BbsA subunit [Papillibacter cinnamivorans DSM 12816]